MKPYIVSITDDAITVVAESKDAATTGDPAVDAPQHWYALEAGQ